MIGCTSTFRVKYSTKFNNFFVSRMVDDPELINLIKEQFNFNEVILH